jgi:hypothetical protein
MNNCHFPNPNFKLVKEKWHTCNRDCLSKIVSRLLKNCFHPTTHDSGQAGLSPEIIKHIVILKKLN